jgi:general secretion pathway protein G
MKQEYVNKSTLGIFSGIVFPTLYYWMFFFMPTMAMSWIGQTACILGYLAFIWGTAMFAEGKGYSRWWGILGLGYVFGLLILMFFPDRFKQSRTWRNWLMAGTIVILIFVSPMILFVVITKALFDSPATRHEIKAIEDRLVSNNAAAAFPGTPPGLEVAKVMKTKSKMEAIGTALSLYKLQSGDLPTQDQGLGALGEKPTTPPIPVTWEWCMDGPFVDAWYHDFVYLRPGKINKDTYDLYSKGPNGIGDGNDGDDINNWSK